MALYNKATDHKVSYDRQKFPLLHDSIKNQARQGMSRITGTHFPSGPGDPGSIFLVLEGRQKLQGLNLYLWKE